MSLTSIDLIQPAKPSAQTRRERAFHYVMLAFLRQPQWTLMDLLSAGANHRHKGGVIRTALREFTIQTFLLYNRTSLTYNLTDYGKHIFNKGVSNAD